MFRTVLFVVVVIGTIVSQVNEWSQPEPIEVKSGNVVLQSNEEIGESVSEQFAQALVQSAFVENADEFHALLTRNTDGSFTLVFASVSPDLPDEYKHSLSVLAAILTNHIKTEQPIGIDVFYNEKMLASLSPLPMLVGQPLFREGYGTLLYPESMSEEEANRISSLLVKTGNLGGPRTYSILEQTGEEYHLKCLWEQTPSQQEFDDAMEEDLSYWRDLLFPGKAFRFTLCNEKFVPLVGLSAAIPAE